MAGFPIRIAGSNRRKNRQSGNQFQLKALTTTAITAETDPTAPAMLIVALAQRYSNLLAIRRIVRVPCSCISCLENGPGLYRLVKARLSQQFG